MNTHVYFLANDLQVILVNTGAFPSLTSLLLVGAGSRYENKVNNGIAHFFEHMVFKGTVKYKDTLSLSRVIESLGGVFNAFTAKDHTGYWIKAPSKHFIETLDVLAEMIQRPLLKEEEIEREKGVIVEEINMYEDDPQRRVVDFFENLVYQGSPLGMDIVGTKQTVSSFNKATFEDYLASLYRPNNAILLVAGGLSGSVKSYLAAVKDKFAAWQKGPVAQFQKLDKKEVGAVGKNFYKKTEQAHLAIGFHAFSFFDPRRYALSVLSALLGGGMSSRLFHELRERRGLCYYVSTQTDFYHDTGLIYTHAGVSADIAKIKQAVSLILEEHYKISKGKLSAEELRVAKEYLKGRLLLSLEDSLNTALFYGRRKLLSGRLETPEEVIKRLDAVKIADVIDLAKELFVDKKLTAALISPFKDIQLPL